MKPLIAGVASLAMGLSLSGHAQAQTAPPAPDTQAAQPAPAAAPQPAQPAPPQAAGQPAPYQEGPAPPASQWTYSYPTGQWVYMEGEGWVWVPAGSSVEVEEGVPYAYLYTPAYGWAWYVSPWGWGPYHYGGWVTHPWRPWGWRGAWVARPGVVVHLGGWHGGVWHGGGYHGWRGGGWHGGGWHGGYHGGYHGGHR